MTPRQYKQFRNRVFGTIEALERALELAIPLVVIPPLKRLRPMRPGDVLEGAVVFHWNPPYVAGGGKGPAAAPVSSGGPDWFWHIIQEVNYPDDDFKAYHADDGCRYGLRHAYVER